MLGGGDATVRAITVGPRLEAALMQLFSPRGREAQRTIDADELGAALKSITNLAEAHKHDGRLPPLVTPPALRVGIRRLLEPVLPRLPVVSLAELPSQTIVQSVDACALPYAV